MKFVASILSVLVLAISSYGQCASCGTSSRSYGGSMMSVQGCSTCGSSQSYATINGYTNLDILGGVTYSKGAIVKTLNNNYYTFDGIGYKLCSTPVDGKYANASYFGESTKEQAGYCTCTNCPFGNCPDGCTCTVSADGSYTTICKDGKCTIVRNTVTKQPTNKQLTEVTVPTGYGLYQDELGSLYILKKDYMKEHPQEVKASGQWVYQKN